MNLNYQRPPMGFGFSMTSLGKKMLLVYGAIYVLELLMEHWFQVPLVSSLVIHPVASDSFHVWQLFTHPFIHDPYNPLAFLLSCLVFYFFAGPVEYVLGTRKFLRLFYIAALGGMIFGLAFSFVPGFRQPFSGMSPSILCLVVIFGLLNPEATIYLMFVIPLKAKYISYATVIITGITFLAKANPSGGYQLGGILFGYLYFRGFKNLVDLNQLIFRFRKWRFDRKKRSRFTVLQGGKGREKDDGPTYH